MLRLDGTGAAGGETRDTATATSALGTYGGDENLNAAAGLLELECQNAGCRMLQMLQMQMMKLLLHSRYTSLTSRCAVT